jgi:hypothetical protein
MELGSVTLKRIGFFCFPIKHSTHTQGEGRVRGREGGREGGRERERERRKTNCDKT